eukprot:XP_011447615.1 PREDICTED: uncharacterized protein LOC105342384 [Crassostrea gigas]
MFNRVSLETVLYFIGLLLLSHIHGSRGNCTVEKPGTFPYFFGRTDDECIDRVKRAALSPQRLSHKNGNHMWIQYRGIFFEFGVGKSRDVHVSSSPYGHGECASQIESLPAGYSILSVECLEKCAKNYSKRFGLFNDMYRRVHPFVNMMSRILCLPSCPEWCIA